jgi:hypothetical protein
VPVRSLAPWRIKGTCNRTQCLVEGDPQEWHVEDWNNAQRIGGLLDTVRMLDKELGLGDLQALVIDGISWRAALARGFACGPAENGGVLVFPSWATAWRWFSAVPRESVQKYGEHGATLYESVRKLLATSQGEPE